MIYTVTLNPAVDKTVMIPDFRPGGVNRIRQMRVDAGGKGINVSKCLQSLGHASVVCGIFGGSSGESLLAMLRRQGLEVLPVFVTGENRTNLKIVDTQSHMNTDINEPGPTVDEAILTQLFQTIALRLQPGDTVILSGSLPVGAQPGLYRQWIGEFTRLGVRVILDADGEPMRQGVQAAPYLVKPNDLELSGLVGRALRSEAELIEAGRDLMRIGVREVLISRGGDGALYLTQEGGFRGDALKVPVLSTVGAGDSTVAAMAYGFEKGMTAPDRLRLAIAMGAASVTCSGTQAPQAELVWELYQKAYIQEV